MMTSIIQTKVQGEDIDQFVKERLLPVIQGERLDLVAASMLTVLLSSMAPEMEPTELGNAVTNVAQYIITYMSSAVVGDTAEVVN